MDFAPRLLEFPVRTAAAKSLLADLKGKHLGNLAEFSATLNDAALSEAVLAFWIERGWIARAPNSPMYIYPGESFSPEVSLQEFCGVGYDSPSLEGIVAEES
jgi:hypothetical protein